MISTRCNLITSYGCGKKRKVVVGKATVCRVATITVQCGELDATDADAYSRFAWFAGR